MSDEYLYTDVPLVVKHVPDHSMELGPDGNKVRVELPGKVHIGVLIEGAFFPLMAIGKNRLHKHIDLAKAKAAKEQSQAAPSGQA